jgi:hypothetical protein
MSYVAEVLQAVPPKVLTGRESKVSLNQICATLLKSTLCLRPSINLFFSGSVLCDFVLGRIEGDAVGMGADAKALLGLEELGKWDEARASQVMTT